MKVTDVHAHVIVPEITRDAAPHESWRPRVWREPSGAQVVELDGREVRSMVQEVVDIEAILAAHERAGVQRVVLSPVVSLAYYDQEPAAGLERCRIQNDALERVVRDAPQRIAALGLVPLQDPELAAAELRALMARGRLRGVELGASVRDVYLGDDRFEPFWQAAADTGAVVFIHPTTRGFGGAVFSDYYLWNLVGNPMETTVTAAHMLFAGVLERHPALRVVLAHGGGAMLALRGRLRHGQQVQSVARERLQEPLEQSLRRFHFDTVVHDPQLLAQLVDFAGAQQVLLGSDFPFDMGDPRPADTVRSAGLEPQALAAVLGENAQRLFWAEGATP